MISVDNLVANYVQYVTLGQIIPSYNLVTPSLIRRTEPHADGSNTTTVRDVLLNFDNMNAAMSSDIFAFQPELDTAIQTIQSIREYFNFQPKLFLGQFTVSDSDSAPLLAQKTGDTLSMFNRFYDAMVFQGIHNNMIPSATVDPVPINDLPAIARALNLLRSEVIDSVNGQDLTGNIVFALTGVARGILSYVSPEGNTLSLDRTQFIPLPSSMVIPGYENAIYAIYQPYTVLHRGLYPAVIATERALQGASVPSLRKTTVILGTHSVALQKYEANSIMALKVTLTPPADNTGDNTDNGDGDALRISKAKAQLEKDKANIKLAS